MKKRFALIACTLAMVCWSGMALAATINYTFTADNKSLGTDLITGFYLADGNGNLLRNIEDKNSYWTTALTNSFDFAFTPGETYTLNWKVQNDGGIPTSTNPMAFLGMFSVFGTTYVSGASGSWLVDDKAPNSLGLLSEDNVWRRNGASALDASFTGFAPVWIGYNAGINVKEMLVTASFTAPVPLPGAAILLGSGLLGLVGLRRRQIV